MSKLNAKIPEGPLAEKWTNHKAKLRLVNPANRRKLDIIVVGTGLAGSSAASTLGELGYNVKVFCYQDSPRRAHSVAAQGGINAAKNYKNDNDSVYRLFYDMIKGGDFRAREANVYRAAEVSNLVIDHYTALGVPFARDYGGLIENRSFGGVQVSRTFYAKGQTGQQCLIGAYSALSRQIDKGTVTMYPRREMMDLVVIDGKARGIIVRNLVTGEIERHSAHAVVLATGGYGTIYYLSTLALNSNGSAAWRAHKRGALFANPSFVQIHPTSIPVLNDHQCKLTLMSESLRNDGRVWVPKTKGDPRKPNEIPEDERDYYLERRYPAFGNLVPRDVASRAAKERCDAGYGVGPTGLSVYLDFRDAIQKKGRKYIEENYGNLFEMYEKITGESPYEVPMRIYPAGHYTMGGLWVDYNLMTTIPGLYAIGEANFSDHGANRLGASSLMQTSGDGYFILPYTIADYLADEIKTPKIPTNTPEFDAAEKEVKERIERLMAINGTETATSFHKRLGKIMWDYCGMVRNEEGLKKALTLLDELKDEFWKNLKVPDTASELNQELEKANRVADFLELGKLMVYDALNRKESCGAHFREESQTETGEAKRDDENYSYVAAWEFTGDGKEPILHKEELKFEYVKLQERSYK
ncbi:MAG: fumarate reductase/succinate dehydrogenase flavoprotein subunit [Tenuifilum sp.]|uniref:fumarate reductase/succinate dehydrogenase flavoprotein subunit n=1 Tax=Tenuifilum sp. TaxID=2760880 RepID=UPI001B6ADE18|nr:fumarate reductase/succinate dehydrogenase flavoprotein subunit [Bacteroidales bacterium]HOK60715.1 fumarate reductase/succinate dehydrogenase flavoprotein subunit [Tenuifilum sp.]MBP9029713.1 fumarate reductase/succinate dehydrogenase flavoprotein subunit [Bacteroidales bacterium]HOK85330.1 fumarate reductase/succinate dehydrogenase flavoprotein subunit [Tenuifilum sp.]HON70873.1 fumarate reductase/succinate dehydrogenase flavoprotein subunit [Tenuifilum sp.]